MLVIFPILVKQLKIYNRKLEWLTLSMSNTKKDIGDCKKKTQKIVRDQSTNIAPKLKSVVFNEELNVTNTIK